MFSSNGASQSSAAGQMRPMYPSSASAVAATVAASTPRSAIESYWCPSYPVGLSYDNKSYVNAVDELLKHNNGLWNVERVIWSSSLQVSLLTQVIQIKIVLTLRV